MGIKICPQCNGKVSDTRNNCPHCEYDFTSVKKCRDCEELIDASLAECPVCGHIFVAETTIKEVHAPQVKDNFQEEQPVQDADSLVCPYCNSTESMAIGNDSYMCIACKNKFLNTRGLPTPPLPNAKKEQSVTSDKDSKVDETVENKDDNIAPSPTTKSEHATNKREGKARLVNIVSLAIGIVCWLSALVFMFVVTGSGSGYRYLSLIESGFFEGDLLSLLTVIFVFAFGFCLVVEFALNLFSIRKTISVIVSLMTLLMGAAAVSIASCLNCDGRNFFSHSSGWSTITLISLLGVSSLCKIISFVAACTAKRTKPDEAKNRRKIAIILSIMVIFVVCAIVAAPVVASVVKEKTKELEIGNIYKIENGVFVNYDREIAEKYGITELIIPEGVTSIRNYAVRWCDSLKSVIIPEGVTNIGMYAFSGCTSLESVKIPSSVTSIGYHAFSGCTSLTSVTIPNSVTTIGEYAFYDCNSLTIYCEAYSQRSEWDSGWNTSGRPVVWGHTHAYENGSCVCGKTEN